MPIRRTCDLEKDHIWDSVAAFGSDAYAVCDRYIKEGQLPPMSIVRHLELPEGKTTEYHRRVLRAARRTALIVTREARGEVTRIRGLKQTLRRGLHQLGLPFGQPTKDLSL